MSQLVIHTDFTNNKLEYVCDFIFRKYLRLDFEFVHNEADFQKHPARIKICYGRQAQEGALLVPDSGLLETFDYSSQPDMSRSLTTSSGQLNFDLFAASFYLLTRAEEYINNEKDVHERFKIENSILYRKDWVDIPIVDYWIEDLRKILSEVFEIEIKQKDSYRFLSTIDIDHIYAFRKKPWDIWIGSLLKDLASFEFGRVVDRFSTKDPYDTFDDIVKWHQSQYLNPVFFVLCADRGPYDKTLSHTNPDYIEKVNFLNKYYNVGIHPSYASQSQMSKMQHEKLKLETVIGEEIFQSRQHYLKFSLPETYKNLIKIGITKEYSMGFHERLGFRTGSSHVHYWYDLESDKVTNLKIYPFQAMDITMKKYMELEPEKAFESCKIIIDRVKEVQGVFSLIWHNSSFYNNEGWENWKELYIQIIKYAKP